MKSLRIHTKRFVISVLMIIFVAGSYENARADFTFGPPVNLGSKLNTRYSEGLVCIASDNLSIYFTSNRPGGRGNHDLYMAARASEDDEWSQPTNLGATVNSWAEEFFCWISTDGLTLYFDSTRPGGRGARDLWGTTRSNLNVSWSSPVNLGSPMNSASDDVSPSFSADGLTLLFSSNRSGGQGSYDLYICTRPSQDASWSAPVNLGAPINSAFLDVAPSLSSDGLVLFFHSIRPSGFGSYDLYYSRRQTPDAPWSEPVNLGQTVNSSYVELGPSVSADGRMLYFCEHPDHTPRPGGFGSTDLWQVPIDPVIDLNGDGIVDSTDTCIVVDNWGTDEPLCDIGPMPWGDGVVDVQDLIILAEHLFEEILPPGLIAYWRLNETQGNIAYNSASDNDGVLNGEPLWQPNNGKMGGALQFDGIDDYVETGFVLDPADGAFSVFAWIKADTLGQVIISQTDGTGIGQTWLGIDPADGKLMTGLASVEGRSPSIPLVSEFVITDGQWHHIGIVVAAYQSMRFRSLYLDGVRIITETLPVELPSSNGGMYIGAGNTLEAGSFFSGLIDDVRIYDVALFPEQIAAMVQ